MEEDGQDHAQVEDDVLRQKEFRRGGGIDLGQFMIQEPENESIVEEAVPEKETDEAVGEIASLFSSEDEQTNEPGAIKRDGTVDEAAAPDSVTDMAVHGERRLGYGLLAGMVLVWSVLGMGCWNRITSASWRAIAHHHGSFRIMGWRKMDSKSNDAPARCDMGHHFDENPLRICP